MARKPARRLPKLRSPEADQSGMRDSKTGRFTDLKGIGHSTEHTDIGRYQHEYLAGQRPYWLDGLDGMGHSGRSDISADKQRQIAADLRTESQPPRP